MEITRSVEVGSGGKVELNFLELPPGQKVVVRVLIDDKVIKKRRKFGLFKGAIRIHENFDDPVPNFEDYM